MLYYYRRPVMSRGSFLSDYGIEEEFFITTNSNLDNVKEALQKRFCEKHEMKEFSEKAYRDALAKGVSFNDGGDALGNHEYNYESAKKSIDDLKLYKTISEKIYTVEKGEESPKYWIGAWDESDLFYMPHGGYFEYQETWDEFKKLALDNPLSIVTETKERPKKSSVPRDLRDSEDFIGRILDDNLIPMKEHKYCHWSRYKEWLTTH